MIDLDQVLWGDTAEVFTKGERIIPILLCAAFASKQSKVKGPAQEIQFLGIKWQDGCCHIPAYVIDRITPLPPLSSKRETQSFLGIVGFWRIHVPNYILVVSPLYQAARKKNEFTWGPEQQQAFEQIKREIACAVVLGPARTGQDVKNILYTAAGEKVPLGVGGKEPQERPGANPWDSGVQAYRGSEECCTPTEKEILATNEGVRAASEVEEMIMDRPEGKKFGTSPGEEVSRAKESPPYNELPENEKKYALFTDGSCCIEGGSIAGESCCVEPHMTSCRGH